MEVAHLRRICAVYASDGINGYPFCLALIKKALESKLSVCALLFLHLRRDLPEAVKKDPKFVALECFGSGSLEAIHETLAQQNISRHSVVFVDSLSVLIEQFSLPSTSWFLTQIGELSAFVLALIHSSSAEDGVGDFNNEDWHRIESIASTVFELRVRDKLTTCRTTTRNRNGTAEVKLEQFSIDDDHSLTCTPFVASSPPNQTIDQFGEGTFSGATVVGNDNASAHLSALPFDIGLNLREEERKAKARVPLPYLDAQTEKGLVGLNISQNKKVWAGGRILYMPEKEDDFDESDPDDDLTV